MLNVRRAQVHESQVLTSLAIRSEAYWGYDSEYMKKFGSLYAVTKEFISRNPVYVMCEDDTIVGFYGISVDDREASLEYFFIDPSRIGKGCGRSLWNHAVGSCRTLGIRELVLVTSPQAKDFYVRMGARLSGEVESLVQKGRMIPRLIYTVA